LRAFSVALALAAIALVGCGTAKKPAPPVHLVVDSPGDMALLHQGSVEVHGVVSPRTASVSIEGNDVAVSAGRFSKTISLLPGTNLIDIVAGAPGGARPAMLALRVRREVTVKIPDLTGVTPSDAKDALAGLGLKPDVQEASGILEFLLPEDARVCDTQPPPGTQVNPGSTVTVFAAKQC
jgi:PASTA domain/Glucodextranase, domain B